MFFKQNRLVLFLLVLLIATSVFLLWKFNQELERANLAEENFQAVQTEMALSSAIDDSQISGLVGAEYERSCDPEAHVALAVEQSRELGKKHDTFSYLVYDNRDRELGRITLRYFKNRQGNVDLIMASCK